MEGFAQFLKRVRRSPSAVARCVRCVEETGVPIDAILEFVKLSDLARIPGMKRIRARLCHDAGVDTIEKLAEWDPAVLRATLAGFIEDTGFEGVAPLPKEVAFSVARARRLPEIVEY